AAVPEMLANRDAFLQLVRSNFFGLNAPAIAAAESLYEEFWATDVSAMVGYHGGASAAMPQASSTALAAVQFSTATCRASSTPASRARYPRSCEAASTAAMARALFNTGAGFTGLFSLTELLKNL
ncbi:MAG: hypothetical protein QOD58_1902, partial [Mycobacterium sp.]|nr:hypothetical protein [Mycobacterium sp.]